MLAAALAGRTVRAGGPVRITVAVPVGPPAVVAEPAADVDAVVCPRTPAAFGSVGRSYADPGETSDAAVVDALRRGGAVG